MSLTSCCLSLFLIFNLQVTATPVVHDGALSPIQVRNLQTFNTHVLGRRADSTALINDVSNPAFLYSFAISDTNGKSLTDNIAVLHQPIISSPTHQKRAVPREMKTCPTNMILVESYCDHYATPQTYRTVCRSPGQYHTSSNSNICAENEICVNGAINFRPPFKIANCVSTDNFVQIIQDQLAQETVPTTIQTNFDPKTGLQYAVEAVMTGTDNQTSVLASNMRIEAWGNNTEKQAWEPIIGGIFQCNSCSSVELVPVPAMTQKILVDVVLPTTVTRGLLYFAAIVVIVENPFW